MGVNKLVRTVKRSKTTIEVGLIGRPETSVNNYQVRTQNFSLGEGADPKAIYNLCLILKIML